MYDIELLKSLVAVIDHGGFTRAAERLNATQSTISGHIRRLEVQVGCSLLQRSTRRSPRPTEEGEILLGYARQILALQEGARRRLSGVNLDGSLRIGMSDDFASGRGLTRVLAGFAALHPAIRLEVEIANSLDLMAGVAAGHFDLTLAKMRRVDGGGEVLWRSELIWAGRAEMARMEPLPLVLFPAPCAYRDRAMAVLREAGRDSRVVYTSPSLAGILAALAAGLGIAPLANDLLNQEGPRIGAESGLPNLGLVEIVLHRDADAKDPAADALVHLLREHWHL